MNATMSHSREDLYTYEEAAAVVGCHRTRIVEAVSRNDLTAFRDGHRKWLLKKEIDAIAGMKRIGLKEARAKLAAVRGPRNYVAEELNYGDPIQGQSVESAVRHIYAKDPSTFMATLTKLIGGKIHVEYV